MSARRIVSLWCLVCVFVAACTAYCYAVHVKGYTRKDGTYVAPHERRSPGTATNSSTSTSTPRYTYSPRISTRSGCTYSTSHHATGYVGARDSTGRIVRSESARRQFMRMSAYPHGRPGYVVDHIIALKRGGPDIPSNMQWQTIAEAKAKDKWE